MKSRNQQQQQQKIQELYKIQVVKKQKKKEEKIPQEEEHEEFLSFLQVNEDVQDERVKPRRSEAQLQHYFRNLSLSFYQNSQTQRKVSKSDISENQQIKKSFRIKEQHHSTSQIQPKDNKLDTFRDTYRSRSLKSVYMEKKGSPNKLKLILSHMIPNTNGVQDPKKQININKFFQDNQNNQKEYQISERSNKLQTESSNINLQNLTNRYSSQNIVDEKFEYQQKLLRTIQQNQNQFSKQILQQKSKLTFGNVVQKSFYAQQENKAEDQFNDINKKSNINLYQQKQQLLKISKNIQFRIQEIKQDKINELYIKGKQNKQ